MASVLRSPTLHSAEVLTAPQPLLLDADWARMLDEAREDAFRAGVEAGIAQGEARVIEQIGGIRATLEDAVAAVRSQLEEARSEWAGRLLHTAVDLAEQLVGATEPDRDLLLSRLGRALAELDAPLLEVTVAPADLEMVSTALDDERARVVADPGLEPGEARIVGEWCDADLTWKTIFEAVREALDA